MQNLRSILLTGLCLFYGATTSASAAVTVFGFTYSGASFGNSAVATGQITLDTALLGSTAPFSSVVSGLSLTVSGATFAADNGTFGLADYNHITWVTGGVSLDFNSELVGQGGWGPIGNVGDFGLSATSIGLGARATSKQGNGSFRIRTGGRSKNGDTMRLTSFEPAAVPEPSRALLGALGVLGLVLRRRRSC
jgi:MYXO-CTERM domain-containing protein